MMSWDDSGHHLQLDALKKVKLATTDPRDTRDHHPALNLAGGLIGSVIVRPDIRSTAPRSIDQHVRSLVELASENLDIFTIGAVNRIGSVNASVVQKFHQTMQRQLDTAMKA
ncbi:MAG: hypothetical protein UZ21_OP11001000656 [Microgenomates bacterium OLB22]|nr:MAG: hypothetical protein UZ21_OP11001000656 [Microgenomates bacterium OLB22]